MSDLGPFTRVMYGLPAALTDLRYPLPIAGADVALRTRAELVGQLRDYLLPRLAAIDAPLLAVVGGSTGAGKSTLVNSLVGRVVTAPGVLRPTTKAPVLVYHPSNEMWFNSDRVLPGLVRSRVGSADTRTLQLVPDESIPEGLAILDAPDIDSIDDQNRALAATLLAAADLWLFVTSAARYADAVPWDYLAAAAQRGASVAVVLDRVPPAAMADVPRHLGQLMTERGLADSLLFAVPETTTDNAGLLPDEAVAPIRSWLGDLARESDARRAVIRRTLVGAVRSLEPRLEVLAQASDDQVEALNQLSSDAVGSFAQASKSVSLASSDGTLLRGEVLTRWQDFVGTGEFMRAVERRISWFRDKVIGPLRAYSPEADQVQLAVGAGLEALVRNEGEAAVERAELAWRSSPAGRFVLAQHPELARVSPDFDAHVTRAIRDWQRDVLDLVAGEGQDRRTKARYLALGVNGMGAALIIFLFASTGGLTGAEVGVAGGTSILAQRLLEAVFGDGAVRTLAQQAKRLLDARVDGVLALELARYQAALDAVDVPDDAAGSIRGTVAALTQALIDQPIEHPELSDARREIEAR